MMFNKQEKAENHIYHIRFGGELDEKWASWFDAFVMIARENGETLLSGPVVDQAALHGVLDKIHGLGLPLLLVVRGACPCSKRNCQRRADCQRCFAYHAEKGNLPYCFRTRNRWDKRCMKLRS